MIQYREYYKKYYGIEFSKNFEVHHIDQNRENNDISNLVLLPRKLHKRYHCQKILFENNSILDTRITGNCNGSNSVVLYEQEKFLEVLKECNKWYDYKLYLEGKVCNIHNIKEEDLLK